MAGRALLLSRRVGEVVAIMFPAGIGGGGAKVVDRGLRRSCCPCGFVCRRPIRRPFAGSRVAAVGVAACMAVGVLPGCSSQWTADQDEYASQPTAESAAVHDHSSGAAAVKAVDASDLRAKLEQLLGQHAILTVRLTRARLHGDGDLAQVADAALGENTADLGELIGTVYGGEAAEKFEQLWFGHVTYLFDYSRGVADKDEAVKSQARRQLDDYTTNLSQFLEAATKKAAPAPVVAAQLRMHVDHLLQQVDAYASEDYERAFALERESYAHMFPLGKALAAGIVAGEGDGVAGRLRQPGPAVAVAAWPAPR